MNDMYIIRNLIAAIINQAIHDWCMTTKCHNEVREFFQSDLGIEYCHILGLSTKDILNKLESGKINLNGVA